MLVPVIQSHASLLLGVCAMPLRKLCAPQLLRNWQTFPTERGAQTPRNALKQFMKNQGAHWSRVSTVYGIFGREITKYMAIYGIYIRFWPTLDICGHQISLLSCYSRLLFVARAWLCHGR
jgi:hypothetical protein